MARFIERLLFVACLLCVATRESMQAPTTKVSTTEVPTTTTIELVNTTATTAAVLDPVSDGVGSIAKNNNYTNYALHGQKLLVNGSVSLDTSQLPRNIATSASQSSAGISITLMAVLLVVIVLVVSIILTAVFVMRRRFSIWRVNGDRMSSGGRDDGAKGALTKSTSSENTSTTEEATVAKVENEKTGQQEGHTLVNNESKKSIECEKKLNDEEVKEVVASCIAELNSVENPQAAALIGESVVAKPETTVEVEVPKSEEVKADVDVQGTVDQQPSPATSETRLIETTPAEPETKSTVEQIAKSASTVSLSSSAVNPVSPIPSTADLNPSTEPAVLTTVTSTSLITNVISDIADSVAAKLGSKSALNDNTDDKQPLNNE